MHSDIDHINSIRLVFTSPQYVEIFCQRTMENNIDGEKGYSQN